MYLHGLFFVFARDGGEKERQTDRERDRDTHTQRERQRHTEKQRDRTRWGCLLTKALTPFWGPQPQLGFPCSSVVIKNLPQCRRPRFDSWVGKIPWRWKWLPTPVFLPVEFHGKEEPDRLQSIGLETVRHY